MGRSKLPRVPQWLGKAKLHRLASDRTAVPGRVGKDARIVCFKGVTGYQSVEIRSVGTAGFVGERTVYSANAKTPLLVTASA